MTFETIQSTYSPVRSERRATRTIVSRTAGRSHGPVNRLFGPGDLCGPLKPFVFLDYFDIAPQSASRFPMHRHSGIATTTILLDGEVGYEDTTAASGVISAGSVEWMNAGRGVSHDGYPEGRTRVRGYQIWTALPREQELGEPLSQYLSVDRIRTPARPGPSHFRPLRRRPESGIGASGHHLSARAPFGRRALVS